MLVPACRHSMSVHSFVCMLPSLCYLQDCRLWGHLRHPVQLQEHASDCRTETQTPGRTLGVSQPCRQGNKQQENCKHHTHAQRPKRYFLTARRAGRDWLTATASLMRPTWSHRLERPMLPSTVPVRILIQFALLLPTMEHILNFLTCLQQSNCKFCFKKAV